MMRKNLSSFRILSLVVASVLMSALVTLIVYSTVAPRVFTRAKVAELSPGAQFLAEQASLHFQHDLPVESIQRLIVDTRQWGAMVWVFDDKRILIASTEASDGNPYYASNKEAFDVELDRLFSGQNDSFYQSMRAPVKGGDKPRTVEQLIISLPVTVDDEVRGGVIMLKPQEEIDSAMSTLSTTIWLSVLAVLCAMLPLAYWMARLITKPIREIRAVALNLAEGDFSVRAPVHDKGEIGDLARAFNLLSDELGNSIGDLTRERNQALAIVNTLQEGILSVDGECVTVQTNPALETMLAANGNGEGLPPEVWEHFRAALASSEANEFTFPLGELLLRLTVMPIGDARAGVASAIGVFHDETEASRLEQTRREYVANVSHELRTPLTALRALIEPLRDGLIRTDEKRNELYDIILRETMRLSRLVDDMLELSRLQSGSLALEKIRFQIEPLLHDTASIYAAKAAKTGHVLELNIVSRPLPTVLCNPDRTEQVLAGLLNNAFTYTPSGSHIYIRAEAMDDHLLVTVEDDGPGICAEDLQHVFDRFYKADKSHGGKTGTGLGLAIARELMTRLGETITAQNRPEGGARFMFTLHYK